MKTLFIILAISIISGCALLKKNSISVDTSIDAISGKATVNSKIWVNDLTSKTEIEKSYYNRYAKAALSLSKFKIVQNKEEADYIVLYQFGLFTREKTGSKPTFSWKQDYNNPYGIGHAERIGTEYYQYDENTRAIVIQAFDKKEFILADKQKRNPEPTWKVQIASIGSVTDMKKIFPFLMAATIPYFGENTNGSISENIPYENFVLEKLDSAYNVIENQRIPANK